MDFVNEKEVLDLLQNVGVTLTEETADRVYLHMEALESNDDSKVVRAHIATPECELDAHADATTYSVARDELAAKVDEMVHRLRLDQVILMPVGPWKKIFDVVAFSLAENEEWQAIDAAATVELNTRDPLLCNPSDYHTLTALLKALVQDAESEDEALCITTGAAPVVIILHPQGAAEAVFGSQALADEAMETMHAS